MSSFDLNKFKKDKKEMKKLYYFGIIIILILCVEMIISQDAYNYLGSILILLILVSYRHKVYLEHILKKLNLE